MNALVDLTAAKANRPNEYQKGFDEFVAQSVEMNRDMLISTINNLKNYEPTYIVDSVVFQIISAAFANKSHQELLEAISSGSIFKLRKCLKIAFEADEVICKLLSGGNKDCTAIV
ncbi:hypothetical protein [Bacillus norwichensis]|uniref:WH2 domain-containing protein n=1 Tax=Bacillus norwichensis TaxID=2762217 RepID=A0ABR8VIH5_9BACI|nr:hypothetical protein [Bacillus norwichensis]MBD8004557.1 hypothetical protein [Bacillus norwichensis]